LVVERLTDEVATPLPVVVLDCGLLLELVVVIGCVLVFSVVSSCVTNTVVVLTGGAGVLATVTDFSVVVSAGAVVAVTSPLRVVLVSTFVVVGWTVFVVVTSTTGVVDSDT